MNGPVRDGHGLVCPWHPDHWMIRTMPGQDRLWACPIAVQTFQDIDVFDGEP